MSLIVRGIEDVYAQYCRTVITNKYVDHAIHGNKSLKNLCTDHDGLKKRFFALNFVKSVIFLAFDAFSPKKSIHINADLLLPRLC